MNFDFPDIVLEPDMNDRFVALVLKGIDDFGQRFGVGRRKLPQRTNRCADRDASLVKAASAGMTYALMVRVTPAKVATHCRVPPLFEEFSCAAHATDIQAGGRSLTQNDERLDAAGHERPHHSVSLQIDEADRAYSEVGKLEVTVLVDHQTVEAAVDWPAQGNGNDLRQNFGTVGILNRRCTNRSE